jgi:hypothetical protein
VVYIAATTSLRNGTICLGYAGVVRDALAQSGEFGLELAVKLGRAFVGQQ